MGRTQPGVPWRESPLACLAHDLLLRSHEQYAVAPGEPRQAPVLSGTMKGEQAC